MVGAATSSGTVRPTTGTAASTVHTSIRNGAFQTSATTARNPWGKLLDPRLAPPQALSTASPNDFMNMLEMDRFLSSLASRGVVVDSSVS